MRGPPEDGDKGGGLLEQGPVPPLPLTEDVLLPPLRGHVPSDPGHRHDGPSLSEDRREDVLVVALLPVRGNVGVVVADGAPGLDHLLDLAPVEGGKVGGVAELSEPFPDGVGQLEPPEVEERPVGVGKPSREVEQVDEVLDGVEGGGELGERGDAPLGALALVGAIGQRHERCSRGSARAASIVSRSAQFMAVGVRRARRAGRRTQSRSLPPPCANALRAGAVGASRGGEGGGPV